MPLKLGYLLPTRERIMVGKHDTQEILNLGDIADKLGVDSVWIGDSLLAKPRHDPLSLIAAIAGRTNQVKIGTAVLLPMLRNPVLLAHQVATIDQISEGRMILGVGTARDAPAIRNEFEAAGVPFEKRVGRMMEGIRLCKSLWRGEPVHWRGRWDVECESLGMLPYREGGPPIWGGGSAMGALNRAGKNLDGWFPVGPDAKTISEYWKTVQQVAQEEGRNNDDLTCAAYVTLSINNDVQTAQENLDDYLSGYYGAPADFIKKQQFHKRQNILILL